MKTSTSNILATASKHWRNLHTRLLAGMLACSGLAMAADGSTASSIDSPIDSPANTMQQAGMVDVALLVPELSLEIRYFGNHTFLGVPVTGYDAPRCWLKREAADALARVQTDLRSHHQRLRVYDCYRPTRAVAHFVRWMNDPADLVAKAEFYPDLDKSQLQGVYISPRSGHSRGATVDLGLLQCDAQDAACVPLDMGTGFDFFGARAHTESDQVTPQQRRNRYRLRDAMAAQGFVNLPEEWWHFRLNPEPTPTTFYDVPVTAPDTPMPIAAIDHLMQAYQGEVPGASLLVLKNGLPLLTRSYGRADLSVGEDVSARSNFRLASVSKQFTAAAVLLLAQAGKLTIDDPVRKWLPALPQEANAITLRHLLTHTSGLIDYEDVMGANWQGQIRDAGVLQLLTREHRLYFQPGHGYRYSNSGYALLALIVERASGKTYPDFLRERIFQPLGMHDTLAFVAGGPAVPHRAWGYSNIDGHWQRTDQSTTSAVLGDGGIYSNIEDMAKWDAALYDDRLLTNASRALAFSPQVEVTGEGYVAQYGFGWRITGDTLWHSGETIGFRNVIVRWPAQHLSVVLLTNRNEPEPYQTALAIGRLFQ